MRKQKPSIKGTLNQKSDQMAKIRSKYRYIYFIDVKYVENHARPSQPTKTQY